MMMQTWIDSALGRLFVLDYGHVQPQCKAPVLILSGFGEATCDKECFMSKLARYLQKQLFRVFQADIYGHGESSGNLEDVSVEKILCSVNSFISYIFRVCGTWPMVISRGIIGTILIDKLDDSSQQLCLNPYYPDPRIARGLSQLIQNKQISFNTLLEGYCKDINVESPYSGLIMILSESGLFHQHNMSREFVTEILHMVPATFSNHTCLEMNEDKTGVKSWSPDEGYRLSEDFDCISLKEDAIWQYAAIRSITQILNKKVDKTC